VVILFVFIPPIIIQVRRERIRRTENDMATLARGMKTVKKQTGYYLRLCDLIGVEGEFLPSRRIIKVKAYWDKEKGKDDTTKESELTIASESLLHIRCGSRFIYRVDNGSLPRCIGDASGSGSGWDENGDGELDNPPPYGTPLDPWGHPYLVAYNENEKVMIIYSAGPNGKLETKAGDTTPKGDDLLYPLSNLLNGG